MMRKRFNHSVTSASDDNLSSVLQNNRSLTENSLRMRAMAYLADIKSSLLTQTIFEVDNDRKQINSYATILNEKNKLLKEQKKEMQNALEEKEKLLLFQSKSAMMGEMIGLIAHQFKQPLAGLSMIANNQLLTIELDEEINSSEIQQDAKDVLSQVRYLSNTVDTFRDFLKSDTKRVEANIKDAIENSLLIVSKSLINHNIEVIKEYKSFLKVNIAHSELMQVFINLINNAKDALVSYEVQDAKIYIRTFDKDGFVVVEIEDNAGGISKENIENIFDVYFTTKEDSNGTGLGLYIVKTIIEKNYHGTIRVVNTKDGAKFTLTLPTVA